MNLLEHYEVLTYHLKEMNKDIPITMNTLANVLSCTLRNAKVIVRNLEGAGWIMWKPGQGRGHYSKIRLLANLDDLVMNKAKEIALKSIDESITYIRKFSYYPKIQQEFIDWIFYSFLDESNDYKEGEIDRLQFPSYRTLPVLDPALINRRTENHFMRHIFNQLVTYDEEKNQHLPQLAHHWRHDHNYTTWIFYLRKNVYFHHGKEMTADDVCYSIERHRNNFSGYQWMTDFIHNVLPLNRYTVKFELESSVPYFLHLVASLGGSVVPNEKIRNFKRIPIGTGPFQVRENNKEKLILQAFKNYYDIRPLLDEVSIYFFPWLYENKDTSPFTNENELNFYHYPYKQKKLEYFEQYKVIDRGSKQLILNMNRGILAYDPLLRKAIFHSLLPEKLIRDLKGNRFIPASRMVSQFEDERSIDRDFSIAKICLKRSSYNGEQLNLFTYNGAGNESDVKWIQKELQQLGIKVSLHFLPYEELHKQHLVEHADMLLEEQLTDESLLYTYLSTFKGNQSLLRKHLPDCFLKEIDLLLQSRREYDLLNSLKDLEDRVHKQNGLNQLYRLQQFAIYPRNLKGIHINALGWVDYTNLWYLNS
ncbi:SgrR family transcriptional regulator [Salinibacillus aidingensis]|uniref:SgrR family transcriptional regulator n=1 Tax=Salinibacillus aidingensis TaxID=237684 RepID=A0ABP3KPZ6_9BACI